MVIPALLPFVQICELCQELIGREVGDAGVSKTSPFFFVDLIV